MDQARRCHTYLSHILSKTKTQHRNVQDLIDSKIDILTFMNNIEKKFGKQSKWDEIFHMLTSGLNPLREALKNGTKFIEGLKISENPPQPLPSPQKMQGITSTTPSYIVPISQTSSPGPTAQRQPRNTSPRLSTQDTSERTSISPSNQIQFSVAAGHSQTRSPEKRIITVDSEQSHTHSSRSGESKIKKIKLDQNVEHQSKLANPNRGAPVPLQVTAAYLKTTTSTTASVKNTKTLSTPKTQAKIKSSSLDVLNKVVLAKKESRQTCQPNLEPSHSSNKTQRYGISDYSKNKSPIKLSAIGEVKQSLKQNTSNLDSKLEGTNVNTNFEIYKKPIQANRDGIKLNQTKTSTATLGVSYSSKQINEPSGATPCVTPHAAVNESDEDFKKPNANILDNSNPSKTSSPSTTIRCDNVSSITSDSNVSLKRNTRNEETNLLFLKDLRKDHKAWFIAINDKNIVSKRAHMIKKSEHRLRQWLTSFQKELNKVASDRTRLDKTFQTLIKDLRKNLNKNKRYENYFDRAADEKDRFCNSDGLFKCQGPNGKGCEEDHSINPYASRKERENFKMWEFDHIIPRQQVLEAAVEKAKRVPKKLKLNWEKYFDYLFERLNLRLVHKSCHDLSHREEMPLSGPDYMQDSQFSMYTQDANKSWFQRIFPEHIERRPTEHIQPSSSSSRPGLITENVKLEHSQQEVASVMSLLHDKIDRLTNNMDLMRSQLQRMEDALKNNNIV